VPDASLSTRWNNAKPIRPSKARHEHEKALRYAVAGNLKVRVQICDRDRPTCRGSVLEGYGCSLPTLKYPRAALGRHGAQSTIQRIPREGPLLENAVQRKGGQTQGRQGQAPERQGDLKGDNRAPRFRGHPAASHREPRTSDQAVQARSRADHLGDTRRDDGARGDADRVRKKRAGGGDRIQGEEPEAFLRLLCSARVQHGADARVPGPGPEAHRAKARGGRNNLGRPFDEREGVPHDQVWPDPGCKDHLRAGLLQSLGKTLDSHQSEAGLRRVRP